jgi:type IV pilus assembly protein PilP
VDRIKSVLLYLFSGLASTILAVQLFIWASPISLAQEAAPNLQAVPPGGNDLPVPPPPGDPAAADAQVPAAPLPVPTPAGTEQSLETMVQSQAGDFLAPYIFDTREGRRNPFRPMVLKDDNGDRAAIGPATPLERYDIDELKLTAIMWDVKSPRAMIMDPNKEMHIIAKDDRIGRRQGYVATIREGELVVVETTDFNGDVVYSTRVMKIEK